MVLPPWLAHLEQHHKPQILIPVMPEQFQEGKAFMPAAALSHLCRGNSKSSNSEMEGLAHKPKDSLPAWTPSCPNRGPAQGMGSVLSQWLLADVTNLVPVILLPPRRVLAVSWYFSRG